MLARSGRAAIAATAHSGTMAQGPVPDLGMRQLQAVLAVAEQGSFVAAAAVLKTSQPALTRTVRRVEDVLGVALFERTTRRVRLTAAGRDFVALAERLLNDLRLAAGSMRAAAEEQRGRVVLASIMSAASGPLPAILAAWHAARPAVELQLREGVHGTVLEDVRGGLADLGITYVDDLPVELTATPLGREVFVAVAPPAHALATREMVALAELAAVPLVSFPPESRTRRTIDAAAAAANLSLRHTVIVTQFATMLRLVRAGVGLAIVPAGALVGFGGEGLVALPLAPPGLSRRIGLVTLPGRSLPPPAASLLALLREAWPSRVD